MSGNEREGLRERIAEELYAMRGIRAHWRHLTESARRIWLQDADRILALLTQAQGYPYEDDKGRTHWEGCWRERGHHNCAVEVVERLTQAQEPVAWRLECAEANLSVLRIMEPHAENYPAHEGWTITPLYASPVASAPDSILRLEGEYTGVRYGEAAIPQKITAAEVFERIRASAPEEELEAFDPFTNLPGEYEIGRAIREAADHDLDRMRFYLTCSIGELAQRIARLRATPAEEQDDG